MEIKFQSTRLKVFNCSMAPVKRLVLRRTYSCTEVLAKSAISRTMPRLRDAMLHMCYNFIALISGTTNVRAPDLP